MPHVRIDPCRMTPRLSKWFAIGRIVREAGAGTGEDITHPGHREELVIPANFALLRAAWRPDTPESGQDDTPRDLEFRVQSL